MSARTLKIVRLLCSRTVGFDSKSGYQSDIHLFKKTTIVLSKELRRWQQQGHTLNCQPGNLKVFYLDLGDKQASAKQTLLLIHGFPESCFSYSYALPYLQRLYSRILLFDFIGFGFSDKPKVLNQFSYSIFEHADIALNVWRQLGVSGGHIVSHDMGNSIHTELMA